jgi:hypothetical protein
MKMKTKNYWVVGAMWSGRDDQLKKFLRRGYWYLGWPKHEQPDQAALVEQMKPNDRIAIKKMLGKGSAEIEIRAIGIIKDVDLNENRIYVNWILADINRKVPGKGCFKTVHGPFSIDDSWTAKVFSI